MLHFPFLGKTELLYVADEMLAILDDRNRIMEKKELEEINKKWNEFLHTGIPDEDE